ncbi:MAG: exonuclease domain-containing protein [Roseiflexus sp.]|nr:exonuclease domain-containing protein [Roseiflexus sp.]MBO9366073.1 exonuclease domain-containing protein [Roseiflexus sp.]MBO9384101.1 exonuclease domain-containing protein [Roseiflexus sp.]
MRITNAFYLIVDVEATCSDDGSVPRHEMEIIEIGAVLQNACTFEVASEFQTFVCPVHHPELTGFCTRLTGITQEQVASAPSFPEALDALKAWKEMSSDALFCSWGEYDRAQFVQDCAFHRVAYPFGAEHLNLKAAFARARGLHKPLGIAAALRSLGMAFEGTHHRAIDDARTIARIVRWVCIGTQAPPAAAAKM